MMEGERRFHVLTVKGWPYGYFIDGCWSDTCPLSHVNATLLRMREAGHERAYVVEVKPGERVLPRDVFVAFLLPTPSIDR